MYRKSYIILYIYENVMCINFIYTENGSDRLKAEFCLLWRVAITGGRLSSWERLSFHSKPRRQPSPVLLLCPVYHLIS